MASRPYVGAVELSTIEGSRALAARGHEQHVVLAADGPVAALAAGHATVHVVAHNPWSRNGVRTTARWVGHDVAVALRRMTALLRAVRPDVVITETMSQPTGALAAAVTRTPHVWFLHGVPNPVHPYARPVAGTWATMHLVGILSERVLCVSEAVRRDAERWIPRERLRVVRYAAELEPVVPAPRPDQRYRLIVVGVMSRGKGQHEAIEALRLLTARGVDATLDLVGSSLGDHEEALHRLAGGAGLDGRVRFVAHTPDALAMMAGSDVLVVCSRHESYSRVVIEAMKLGVPVVAAADYGTLEQVEHGRTGLLYEPGRPAELADRLQELHEDPQLGAGMAQRARAWALEHHNAERYGDDLEAALAEVAG